MTNSRFDKQLMRVMAVILGLSLLVGLSAIAAHLYQSAQSRALIQRNFPTAEAARELASQTARIGELTPTYASVSDAATLRHLHQQVTNGLNRIARAADRVAPPGSDIHKKLGPEIMRAHMAFLHARARDRLRYRANIDTALSRLIPIRAELASLVADQIDIARIRVTAGIADLYAHPQDATRSRLDDLADRDFFAFERLSELSAAISQAGTALLSLRDQADGDHVARLAEVTKTSMQMAASRLDDMPSAAARDRSANLIRALAASTGPAGLFHTQQALLENQKRLDARMTEALATMVVLADTARKTERDALEDTDTKLKQVQASSTLLLIGLTLLLVTAVIGGLAAWRFARRRIVARLAAVSRAIVEVARGRHDSPITISGDDEIGRMERALEILRQRAEQARRLRRDLESAVMARTGDLVAEMQAHDAARDQAEAANRAKTDFLARMSHEIRTPLNGVLGMLDLLESDLVDANPEQCQRVHLARQSAGDLLELVNDILTFSAAPPQADALLRRHFNLRDMIGQLDAHLQAQATAKGLTARTEMSVQGPVTLFGDEGKIRQIMLNLISNAVKYTAQGCVTLGADLAQDDNGQAVLSLSVRDTGKGMDPQTVARVFTAYERADPQNGIEGMGLGLAISHRLTQALEGGLVVQSAPGAGSVFTLTVPLAFGDPAQIAASHRPDITPPQSGKRVLVIDDHRVNRMVARGYLERLGAHVTEAATGAEALRRALPAGADPQNDGCFDLILIDLGLPDMDGADVAAALRKAGHPARRVALTAALLSDDAQMRDRLCVEKIVLKPASARALAALLLPDTDTTAQMTDRTDTMPDTDETPTLTSLRNDRDDIGADITADLVRGFLQDLPQALAGLADGPLPPDTIRSRAHRLKGAAANFALHDLTTHLAGIEAQARAGQTPARDLAALPALAEEAAQCLRRAARQLDLSV